MARMIDADRLLWELTALSHGQVWPGWTYDGIRLLIERQPTLTPPNEPLTLDELGEMSYTDWVWLEFPREKPSDNCWERGWKAYRLYSHERYGVSWIAYRRPPEGEEK